MEQDTHLYEVCRKDSGLIVSLAFYKGLPTSYFVAEYIQDDIPREFGVYEFYLQTQSARAKTPGLNYSRRVMKAPELFTAIYYITMRMKIWAR